MVSLESSRLFHALPAADMEAVKAASQELFFAAGKTIFREGDPGNGIYIVKDGVIEISASLKDKEGQVLCQIGAGDLFGEMAVLDNDPRSATASALTDTSLFFIPREKLLEMLEKTPKMSACLVREISRRWRDYNRQYIQEVLQAERLSIVGRFARSIVHDLKNPLNIIGISAELASLESATPQHRLAAKNRIRNQIDRISLMVNELLEFTRGGQTQFVLAAGDYGLFVKQMVEDLKPEVALKSVEIEFLNQPPGVLVPFNPSRLGRVFHNLFHNATEAMPEGGRILLRFTVNETEIITEVEDSGQGIAPEIADKLFQAFATFGKAHGTGLGLSICRKILEDHHGRIYAKNSPNRGALFIFHLPLIQS